MKGREGGTFDSDKHLFKVGAEFRKFMAPVTQTQLLTYL